MTTICRVVLISADQVIHLPKELAFPADVQDLTVIREGNPIIIEPAPTRRFCDAFWTSPGQWPDCERPLQVSQHRTFFTP